MRLIQFEEDQRLREIAFFILIGIMQLIFLWLLTKQLIFHKPIGPSHISDEVLILFNLLILALFILINSMHLKTVITDKYISFKMTPYHIKARIINWSEIKDVKLIKYDGINDFGGYGLRYKSGKGWCYTISGPYGIRIVLNNDKMILIGTYREKEIIQIIDDLRTRGVLN